MGGLESLHLRPRDLFEETPQRRQRERLDEAVDALNTRYGQGAVAAAALLDRRLKPRHARDAPPLRYAARLKGEGVRHLAIPRLTLPNPV